MRHETAQSGYAENQAASLERSKKRVVANQAEISPERPAPVEMRETSREIQEKEKEIRDDVHREIAKWSKATGSRHVPKSVRGLFLLASLFSAETAAAEDAVEKPLQEDVAVQQEAEKPQEPTPMRILPEYAKKAMEKFFAEDTGGAFTVFAKGLDNSEITFPYLASGFLEAGEALEIREGMIDRVDFYRRLPADQFPKEGGLWRIGEDGTSALARFNDKSRNDIRAVRLLYPEEQFVTEMIQVTVEPNFSSPWNEPTLVPVSIDLGPIGGEYIYNAFHQMEIPPFASFGEIPVYAKGMPSEEAQELFKQHERQIRAGFREFNEMYGNPNLVARIVVSGDTDPNASATFSSREIRFNRGLMEAFQDNDLGTRILEEITEHELGHLLFHVERFNDPEVFDSLFLTTAPETLDFINESAFGKLSTKIQYIDRAEKEEFNPGHARDNPSEMMASFWNGLDYPDWEAKIQSGTAEMQQFAYAALIESRENFKQNAVNPQYAAFMGIREGAPIFEFLDRKIDFMESELVISKD